MSKKVFITFVSLLISIIFVTNLMARAKITTLTPAIILDQYGQWKAKEMLINKLNNHQDTVIFGDSTAFGGYAPEILGPHVFNFAMDGYAEVEAYYFLKYMIKKDKIPKNIVLTYQEYFFKGATFWDNLLLFNTEVLTRQDAEEILEIDQKNAFPVIRPYSVDSSKKDKVTKASIPIYYDIASGILNKINPNFSEYAGSVIQSQLTIRGIYNSGGWGLYHKGHKAGVEVFCTKGVTDPLSAYTKYTKKLSFYYKKLIALANENKVKIYVFGGPLAKSCHELGWRTNLVELDTKQLISNGVNIDYSEKIVLPDELMLNSTHASSMGAILYSQKVKAFFDSIK